MTRPALLLMTLVLGLTACHNTGSTVNCCGFSSLHDYFAAVGYSTVASCLVAQAMCDRTEDELLAAPGETTIVVPDFGCDTLRAPELAAQFRIVGVGNTEGEEMGIAAATDVELAELCEQVCRNLPAPMPIEGQKMPHPVIYLCREQGSPQETLIRLVFESQIAGGGLIVTNCEQATRVDASQVCFWRPH